MRHVLQAGENVCHLTRAKWGVGKITSINSCGTIRVVFEGNKILSIAKGINYLVKVDPKGNKL
ncbi:hypothetical protein [Desulfopila sp. IMCC35008]|uniref:hypothetical protein n=1 Tax=Desulfopila sp. IMCC35008 TaxID=2653858 RepID=UPI0013D5D9FC|nr:hypothetical protein [Desulfopila sp. IMCC35008]